MRLIPQMRISKELWPILFIITGTLLLEGCTPKVLIKDHEWCGDKGSLGASCFHTLITEPRDIPKGDWDDMRFGQICTNDKPEEIGDTFADIKADIEKLCSATNACTYETKKKLADFFLKIEEFKKATSR